MSESNQWIKASLVNFICEAKSVSKQDVQVTIETKQVGYFSLNSLSRTTYPKRWPLTNHINEILSYVKKKESNVFGLYFESIVEIQLLLT